MEHDDRRGTSDVWQPSSDHLLHSRILGFARDHGAADVRALVQRADADPTWFWGEVAEWLGLDWQRAPSRVVDDLADAPGTRWFPDSAFNLCDNAVDRWVRRGRGDVVSLRWETDDGDRGHWTFVQLADQVDRASRSLLQLGVQPGDRVGLQLPMVKEAAVAMLACAKVGAVSVPVFSGFGAAAVVDRLEAAGASVHIVADAYRRRGRRVDVRSSLAPAMGPLTGLRTTIVVRLDSEPDARGPSFPGEVSWDALLSSVESGPLEATEIPSTHPLMLAFTSGSTGRPKGVVLTHSGFAVKAGSDVAFSFDLGPSDTAAWITDPGWVMFPITLLGGLIAGSAVALFGGTPDHPDTGRLWDFCRASHVTMLGLSPTLVRLLMSKGATTTDIDKGALRVLASSGEPWTPDAYDWLFRQVFEKQLPIINYSGGTEVSGGILSNTTAEPIHPCAFAGPLPGMGAAVIDAQGRQMETGLGELALGNHSPGMPTTFWNDHQRYVDTYWTTWPGLWHHGDWAERDGDRWYIRGRSDDTLKIAGKRIGPAEIESVVNSLDGVIESAAVGVADGIKGDALVVFARLNDDTASDQQRLDKLISDTVVAQLGPALRPREVHVVSTLPRTRSGKILRRVIRAVYCGEPPGDVSSIEDLSAVGVIEAIR